MTTMPYITVASTRYYYIESGIGQPVLLLHGFTGCTQNWAEVMRRLSAHRSVIAIDLPGHGLTLAPDDVTQFTLPVVSQQLARFITSVIGSPTQVVGYSMGGRLALHLALEFPTLVQSLLLESASPGLMTEQERTSRIVSDEALALRIERNGTEAFVAEWERLPLWASQAKLDEETRARLHAQRLQNNPRGLALSLRGMGTGAQPSLWHRLGELDMPTLVLAGELDTKFVGIAQRMVVFAPKIELRVVPNAGHTIHLEQPDEFVARVSGQLGNAAMY